MCDNPWINKLPPVYVTCKGKEAVGDSVSDAASNAWANIVHSFAKAAGAFVKSLATEWLGIDSPKLSASGGPVGFIFGHTTWLVASLSVLMILLVAGRMAWTQKADGAREAGAAAARVIVTQGIMVAAVNLLLVGGDKFAVWIVNESTKCGGADQPTAACNKAFASKMAAWTLISPGATELLGMTLVFSLLLIIASVVQIGFMLCRNAMVIVLVSTMPLAAAVSGTEQGRGWWRKSTAWLLAFILYKPVAAIVYATAFAAITKGGTDDGKGADVMVQMSGVVLMVLAALTLPALMRIATPLVDSVAQGRGGSTASALGAIGAVASGAVAIKTGFASKAAAGKKGAPGGGAKGAKLAGGGSQTPGKGSQPTAPSPHGSPGGKQGAGTQQQPDPRTTSGSTAPAHQGGPTGTATRTRPPRVSAPRQSDEEERGPSGSA